MKKIIALALFSAAMVQAQEPKASTSASPTPIDFSSLFSETPRYANSDEKKQLQELYKKHLENPAAYPAAPLPGEEPTNTPVASTTDTVNAANPSPTIVEAPKELPKEGAPTFKRPNSIASNTNPAKPAPVVEESPTPTPEAPKEFCSGEGEKIVTLNRGTKFAEVCLLANGKSVSKDKYGK